MKDHATSLVKALDLLSLLGSQKRSFRVHELADAMNLHRSTVIRILNTLVEYGLVAKGGVHYRTTEAFQSWAKADRHQSLKLIYRPVLEAVSKASGQLVLLGIQSGAGIVHIDYVESNKAVRVAPAPETRHNIRTNALGKLCLAMRADLAEKWIATDPAFAQELESIRRTGIAWNREESVPGMVAMACYGFSTAPTEPKVAVAWPTQAFSEAAAIACARLIQRLCSTAHHPTTSPGT